MEIFGLVKTDLDIPIYEYFLEVVEIWIYCLQVIFEISCNTVTKFSLLISAFSRERSLICVLLAASLTFR